MKKRERLKERRAISPVISALILSAVVLTIGGVVWAFSQGAMIISAEDYSESMIEMTDTISERFIIEHAAYIESNLKVWIYNYGTVDIDLKVEVKSITYPTEWKPIARGGFEEIDTTSFTAGEELVIRAYTKRGNNAYYRFIVP